MLLHNQKQKFTKGLISNIFFFLWLPQHRLPAGATEQWIRQTLWLVEPRCLLKIISGQNTLRHKPKPYKTAANATSKYMPRASSCMSFKSLTRALLGYNSSMCFLAPMPPTTVVFYGKLRVYVDQTQVFHPKPTHNPHTHTTTNTHHPYVTDWLNPGNLLPYFDVSYSGFTKNEKLFQ